jgi:hypothetical protein
MTGGVDCHDAAFRLSAMAATKAARSGSESVATEVPLIPMDGSSSSPAIGCPSRDPAMPMQPQ